MDLVDIDQVLNNLEILENENNKSPVVAEEVIANNTVGKSFIGVSQVLNSLDEYRKNVESLETAASMQTKYDEECRPMFSKATIRGKNKSDLSQCDTDEEAASSDIHKFVESTISDRDSSTTNSSDSLTTSSSSTFSSGTGLASITDDNDPCSQQVINDEEEKSSLLPVLQSEINLHEEHSEPEQQIPLTKNKSSALDDLACGLSSISINTSITGNTVSDINCEPTVSSGLNNILDNLSKVTNTSLQIQKRDCMDREKQDSASVLSESSTNFTDKKKEVHQKEEKYEVNIKELETKVCAKFIKEEMQSKELAIQKDSMKPATFSSTMDEISDTELDSMLQEMDIDAEDGNINKTKSSLVQIQNLDKEPILAQKIAGEASEAVEEYLNNSLNDIGECSNGDNFSQASTVEFSEIRSKTEQQMNQSAEDTENEEIHTNSMVSSYTSSESSSEGGESIDDENKDSSQLRPQRPTTLNLPTLEASLYSNAGQTPPGGNVIPTTKVENDSLGAAGIGDNLREYNESNENNILDEYSSDGLPPHNDTNILENEVAEATGYSDPHANLGKVPPIWIPDNMASSCMQCHTKFTMIKRRHHCRACGKVLCSLCCSQKFKLDFLSNPESRVCVQCYLILTQRQQGETTGSELNSDNNLNESIPATVASQTHAPNPNNPLSYCSTIPPYRQVNPTTCSQPPSVIVPKQGVLKKDGSYSSNSSNSSIKQGRKRKSVMFSDGIAPGSELANLEHQEAKHARRVHQQRHSAGNKPPTPAKSESYNDPTTVGLVAQLFRGSIPTVAAASSGHGKNLDCEEAGNRSVTTGVEKLPSRPKNVPPSGCDEEGCFIPSNENSLPPSYIKKDDNKCEYSYKEVLNNFELIERLQSESITFAVRRNFFVEVKIVNLKCCMNRTVINFTTSGMHHVGNDEIIILLEFCAPSCKEDMVEPPIPKDIFVHLNEIYCEAELGNPIAELSYTIPRQGSFLGSREYGGFIYIRSSFQCLQNIIVPDNPFLIGILIHRSEIPWAKVFALRLMLRLGAQYRYYPCPHISFLSRESVYAEIASTIINFLADFRNYSYTLPRIRGMYIHMEDRQTTVLIPRNRQEDVIKAINNASDHILAFGGNFSKSADGHLVCMQNVNDKTSELYSYSTQAINIQGQPRKVTGASFFVLNEALKSTSGLSGKCSIVEDGLMVQILPAKMEQVKNALRNQNDIEIICGPVDVDPSQAEVVSIKWVENDRDFNIGVKSPIDGKTMEGISSMRVHASFNYSNTNYSIRLTDIYILKFDEWYKAAQTQTATSMDITRIAEQIARSASMALVPFLDLLATNGNLKIGLRVTLHQDNVCYEAGTHFAKLPPLYMNALDNHLIPTLHRESTGIEDAIILELIFYILNA